MKKIVSFVGMSTMVLSLTLGSAWGQQAPAPTPDKKMTPPASSTSSAPSFKSGTGEAAPVKATGAKSEGMEMKGTTEPDGKCLHNESSGKARMHHRAKRTHGAKETTAKASDKSMAKPSEGSMKEKGAPATSAVKPGSESKVGKETPVKEGAMKTESKTVSATPSAGPKTEKAPVKPSAEKSTMSAPKTGETDSVPAAPKL